MTEAQALDPAEVGDKGLKKDAIGFLDGLVIGISSTAPAYSLAAVLAIVVVGGGRAGAGGDARLVHPDVPDRVVVLST